MRRNVGDGQGAAAAMQRVGTACLILRFAEKRQNVVKTPACISKLAPMIEILRLTTYVKQTVDRTRSAQDFAARLDDAAAIEFGRGLRTIQPVNATIGE